MCQNVQRYRISFSLNKTPLKQLQTKFNFLYPNSYPLENQIQDYSQFFQMQELANNLKSFIKQFDIFGVPLQLSIQSKEKLYQSTWGGLTTFAIYVVSFLYTLQLLYLWFTSQLSPQTNSQSSSAPEGHSFRLQSYPYTLSLIAVLSEEKKNLIITKNYSMFDYKVTVFGGSDFSQTVYDQYNNCNRSSYQPSYLFTSVCPVLKNQFENTLNEYKSGQLDTFIFYEVIYCDPTKSTLCYTPSQLMDGQGQRLIWELKLFREEVNVQTGEVFTVEKPYYFGFTNDSTQHLNIELRITKGEVEIDTGYFFSQPEIITIIKDVEPFITQQPNSSSNQGPIIVLILEKYFERIQIVFPSFTIILSQIISFFQTLVLCGFLANLLNSSQMEDFMKQKLLQIYFPQFLLIREEKSLFGKAGKVYYNKQPLDNRAILELQEKKQKILELVQRRLNIFYLIQDVSQLQITLQLMQPQQERQTYKLSFLEKDCLQDQQNLSEHDFFKIFDSEQKNINAISTRSVNFKTYPEKSEIMPNEIVSINLD